MKLSERFKWTWWGLTGEAAERVADAQQHIDVWKGRFELANSIADMWMGRAKQWETTAKAKDSTLEEAVSARKASSDALGRKVMADVEAARAADILITAYEEGRPLENFIVALETARSRQNYLAHETNERMLAAKFGAGDTKMSKDDPNYLVLKEQKLTPEDRS